MPQEANKKTKKKNKKSTNKDPVPITTADLVHNTLPPGPGGYMVDMSTAPQYRVDTVTPETSSGESPAEYATEIPPQYDVACAINNPLSTVPIRVDNRGYGAPDGAYYGASLDQQQQMTSPLKSSFPLSPMRLQALHQSQQQQTTSLLQMQHQPAACSQQQQQQVPQQRTGSSPYQQTSPYGSAAGVQPQNGGSPYSSSGYHSHSPLSTFNSPCSNPNPSPPYAQRSSPYTDCYEQQPKPDCRFGKQQHAALPDHYLTPSPDSQYSECSSPGQKIAGINNGHQQQTHRSHHGSTSTQPYTWSTSEASPNSDCSDLHSPPKPRTSQNEAVFL